MVIITNDDLNNEYLDSDTFAVSEKLTTRFLLDTDVAPLIYKVILYPRKKDAFTVSVKTFLIDLMHRLELTCRFTWRRK